MNPPLTPALPSPSLPSPSPPSPPFSGKCGVFGQIYRRFRPRFGTSTWVSKRHWMGQNELVNPRPTLPLPPLPTFPRPSLEMRSFRPEISAQAEISGRRKLLRPKSPDENSSGRSLWKVFLNFFAPLLPFK